MAFYLNSQNELSFVSKQNVLAGGGRSRLQLLLAPIYYKTFLLMVGGRLAPPDSGKFGLRSFRKHHLTNHVNRCRLEYGLPNQKRPLIMAKQSWVALND